MCLITDIKEKFIAQEDMTVYKWLQPNLKSPSEFFQYELGRLYSTEIKKSEDWKYPDATSWNMYFGFPSSELKCYGEGFHTFGSIERAKRHKWTDCCLFACTIPAGSEYYKAVDILNYDTNKVFNHDNDI